MVAIELLDLPQHNNLELSRLDNVLLIRLHRPRALNALNTGLMAELSHTLDFADQDTAIRAVVMTGSEKSFAGILRPAAGSCIYGSIAGADIEEMAPKGFADCLKSNYLSIWEKMFRDFRKPIIAAVNGYALGGGCELAMMCDIIYAGENAKFSQPEIKLGTIPGGGGTQRLTRAIGKSKAMEMILTGNHISALEAERLGLVSKVFPSEKVVEEAIKTAKTISQHSAPIVTLCKESVNKAFELSLREGLEYERRLFHSSFATRDRREGMQAFLEKRPPKFSDE